MSDFDQTSLHEELEVRVIALLTGELSEAEADELEKILAINEALSAFRDQMAGLMGELHQASDELAPAASEPPRRLSEERRAKIFGDARALEVKPKRKRIWFNPAFWGVAASIAMVFMIGIFGSIKFTQSVLREEHAFEAMPIAPAPLAEPEYTVNMRQRNQSTPSPRPPAIVVNDPSGLDIPALNIEVNGDSSSGYGRGGGGFGGGLGGLREVRRTDGLEVAEAVVGNDRADYDDHAIDRIEIQSDFGRTIPVDIPKELIEGTPQPIRVPNLEPAPSEAPRMMVAKGALKPSVAREPRQAAESKSGVREMDLNLTRFGYAGEKKDERAERAERAKNVDPFAAARPSAPQQEAGAEEAARLGGIANSGPVDPFSAPAASRSTRENQTLAKPKSEVAKLSKDGRRDSFSGYYVAPAEAFDEISEIDSLQAQVGQVKSREEMLRQVHQAWERSQIVADASRAYNSSSRDRAKDIVIPELNFSGIPLSQVVETLRELSVVYDPGQKGIPIEYKPVAGQDPRVNISLRNLNLARVLQFVTQQVNYEAVDMDGDFIRIQPAGETAIEKAANARSQNVRQTPKPEKLAAEEPFSTFSLNISDVSFKLAQAALQNSRVPPSAQIRTEEFVNSFDYGDPSPRPDEPVSLHWEMAQHPFEHDRQVVRFSLQTQASGRETGQPLNLSLLVDNSGSMQRPDRRAILQNSLQTLEGKLTPQDTLSIVLFARQPRLIAEAQTRESQKAAVQSALAYRPEGGTNLEAGLKAAYESAQRNYLPSGSNRVILLTDGAANLGNINAGDLAEYVVEQRKQGIALDAYGIGWDDYNDALLEEITRNGDGRYAFLNSAEDASDDFAEKLAGTLRVAAANVKVQIQWNPERVQRYRQIGYDLHQLKKEDFRDNTVDAAEIGEAESGTALYVLKIDDDPEIIGGLGTLHVRYLDPASGLYHEHSWPLPMPRRVPAARAASPSMRLAMSSAFFGERLAASPYASGYSFHDLYIMTSGLPDAFPNQPRVAQMQSMLLQASELYGER